MDDENNNRIRLDTSIIVPIAIAGGITLFIVLCVHCCRRYKSTIPRNRTTRSLLEGSFGNTIDENGMYRNNSRRQLNGNHNYSEDATLGQNHFMPWHIGQGYYQRATNYSTGRQQQQPSSESRRTNYSSRLLTGQQGRPSSSSQANNETQSSVIPSAPAEYIEDLDAPPRYCDAIRYASVHRTNIDGTGMNTLVRDSNPDDVSAAPPPYSSQK